MDAAQLERDRDEHADEHQSPGQVLTEQALDDRAHQRRLRRGQRVGTDGHHVVQIQRRVSDDQRRDQHADDQADLLIDGRGANDEAGLEVLRRRAGIRGGNADDGADAQRDRRVASPVQPSATKIVQVRISVAMVIPEMGFDDVADQADDARRDGDEEEAEDRSISTAARKLPCVGIPGATARKSASSSVPTSTTVIGMSRSVRELRGRAAPSRRSPSCFRGTTRRSSGSCARA